MEQKKETLHRVKSWLFYVMVCFVAFLLLIAGPILINYLYLAETRLFELAFSAGDLLMYYGAVLGGLAVAFTIVITVHINRLNTRRKKQHAQFERAYEVYHKLPEILSRLDIAAVHVRYLVQLSKQISENEVLIETLEIMEEARTLLFEYNYLNNTFYNKQVWKLLQEVIDISKDCHKKVEMYLQDENKEESSSYKTMEDAFTDLRIVIKAAKKTIVAEINNFISINDELEIL